VKFEKENSTFPSFGGDFHE